jgi:hypothetical protein
MTTWNKRFASHRVLRWAAGAGLAAALMLPSVPVGAQTLPLPISGPSTVAATGPFCSIQLTVSNPTPGDQNVPRGLSMSGIAFDRTAESGPGISRIQAFLGNRNDGGMLIGNAVFTVGGPIGAWTLETSIPDNVTGGGSIFVYSLSSITGEEASVGVPVMIASQAPANIPISMDAQVSCPSVLAPTGPIVALSR